MPELIDEGRRLATQETLIPALRGALLLFGLLAAWAWMRRRPALALLLLWGGGLLGLGYWLIQIVAPFGNGTDPSITAQWAQAGASALAEPGKGGYVWDTPFEGSLVATLASLGIPLRIVFATPQITTILCLAFLTLAPWMLIRNPATAAFAGGLALSGGLWPEQAPYGGVLQRPAVFLGAAALVLLAVFLARGRRMRQRLRRFRFELAFGLICVGVLGRAWTGGAEPSVVPALSLAGASVFLAAPLRAALRRLVASPSSARGVEALLLLCVFSGSGLFWWNPARALPGFIEARDGGTTLRKPLDWIAAHVPRGSVVLASPVYSAQIAAFSGRRVLFPPQGDGRAVPEPFRRARLYESCRKGEPIARLADAFSVTHLFLGPGEATPPSPETEDPAKEPRLRLVLVYHDAEDFRVFHLAKK